MHVCSRCKQARAKCISDKPANTNNNTARRRARAILSYVVNMYAHESELGCDFGRRVMSRRRHQPPSASASADVCGCCCSWRAHSLSFGSSPAGLVALALASFIIELPASRSVTTTRARSRFTLTRKTPPLSICGARISEYKPLSVVVWSVGRRLIAVRFRCIVR